MTTKYVYGLGLIGEEKDSLFKTYHFDNRGSTVAITNESGTITDTFAYDTYGKLISHTGTSFVIFGYNGRDGVVTDRNGLIYMRARYYSPAMRRFVNADVIHGDISDSTSLNRYAYVNGNPVSFVDPFGLGILDWVNAATKVLVVTVVVVSAVAVIAGTGGAAAPVVLGLSASAAVGGYFNEKAGGNFASGAVGGLVSGTIQTIGTAVGGPVGTIVGCSVGSGVGTAVTEVIDNAFLPKEKRKTSKNILEDSAKSAGVALATNTLTGAVGLMSKDTSVANDLVSGGWSQTESNVLGAFFGIVDDAAAYMVVENYGNEKKSRK